MSAALRLCTRLLLAVIVAGAVASACSSGSDSEPAETAEEATTTLDDLQTADDDSSDEETDTTTEAPEAATSTPTSIGELEELWSANRQAIVDELTDGIGEGRYGVGDDRVLRGPGGFEVDLSMCPRDWDDNEGVAEVIGLAHVGPQSGLLAALGDLSIGFGAYIDYVNAVHAGVGGVPIELIGRDDGFQSAETAAIVGQLIGEERPLLVQTFGSPNTLAVYRTLNEHCVPHLFVGSSHPAWGDPVNHPWTTPGQLSQITEATLWGGWIAQNMADRLPVRVAALVIDNEFGAIYEQGMEIFAANNPEVIEEFTPIRHSPSASSVASEVSAAAAGDPDVFISMSAGLPCLDVVREAGNAGLNDGETALFAPSVCEDPSSYLVPAGPAAEGWLIVGDGQKDHTEAQGADDPFFVWAAETLEEAGLGEASGLVFTGFAFYGWQTVEAMRIAEALPGGLSRTNLVLASRALDLDHPALAEGVSFSVSGNDDPFFVEGAEIRRYDEASQSWLGGEVVDVDGATPTCAWSEQGCS